MATGIDYLTAKLNNAMESAHVNPALQGLVIGGICQGIGVVLSFLPIIVTLFFFLSIIEDSGYTFPVFYDLDLDASMTYGTNSIPVTFFINADGHLVAYAQGTTSADVLMQGIGMITE